MIPDPDAAVDYLAFCARRHRIWEFRQAGLPQPWTIDPTLSTKKFTNVFRVLDPGTQFVFNLGADDPRDTLARLIAYRYTNRPSTWEFMRDFYDRYPLADDFNADLISNLQYHRDEGNTIFSGAYMIIPQPGYAGDKIRMVVELVARAIDAVWPAFSTASSQYERWDALRQPYGMGNFLSMQILADWNLLVDPDGEEEFTCLGPGSTRGLQALGFLRPRVEHITEVQEVLHEQPDCPVIQMADGTWIKPGLMSTQNTLCELSKYVKGPRSANSGPYRPAHPGPQPDPRYPAFDTWL